MKFKKSTIAIIAVVCVVLIFVIALIGGYNSLVTRQEKVENSKSQIGNVLQRRADLIPNFVKTVKGYSDYESKTYIAVTEARAAVGKATTATEQSEANAQLDKAIDVWVNAVTENYPELKANEQYNQLLDELEGSENRIATARKDYNDAVTAYNSAVRRFPKSIVASIFGFQKADYFENAPGTEKVPEVNFD
ncbi:MAG: LemA family protein [Clostridia bacterium]|nr:LemA family protein [Clostridia bacterium]